MSGISSSLYLVERVVGHTWVQAPPGQQIVVVKLLGWYQEKGFIVRPANQEPRKTRNCYLGFGRLKLYR